MTLSIRQVLQRRQIGIALASLILLASSASAEPEVSSTSSSNLSAHLARVSHEQNVLPDRDNAGFGSLLYDAHGELVLHGRHKTWLYTTALYEAASGGQRDWYGKWVSYVREFDVETHSSGPRMLALGLAGPDRWAVIHDVIQVRQDFYLAFYSANGTVRVAVSQTPGGPFAALPDFQIGVTDEWEKRGGAVSSLESNGAHAFIAESAGLLSLWLGYDSYHVDATAGQLGWARIRIDKQARTVTLVKKHSLNPLRVLPENYIAARCGGNLASSVRLGGQHALFFYSRPDRRKIMLTIALSDDPLFQHISRVIEFEPPLGDERVIEKFETYKVGNQLHLIYENQLASGHWGTGVRVYAILN